MKVSVSHRLHYLRLFGSNVRAKDGSTFYPQPSSPHMPGEAEEKRGGEERRRGEEERVGHAGVGFAGWW